MGTVDVMMTADFTEMAMVVFSAEPLPVPMTMVPFTILRRMSVCLMILRNAGCRCLKNPTLFSSCVPIPTIY